MHVRRDFDDQWRELEFKDNRWLTVLPQRMTVRSLGMVRCPRLTTLPIYLRSRDLRVNECQGVTKLPQDIDIRHLYIKGTHGITHLPWSDVAPVCWDTEDPCGKWVHSHRMIDTYLQVKHCETMRDLSVLALSPESSWMLSALALGRLDSLSYNSY